MNKVFVVCCLVMLVGCNPSNAMTSGADDGIGAASETQSTPFGQKLKLLSVQQFEDRQPIATDDGRPMPARLITLVNFETLDCGTMRDEDFQVKVSRKGNAALVKISAPAGNGQCLGAEKVRFQVGVPGLQKNEAVVITNPALIDELPATE
jgi:hypothetical protein